MYNLITNVLAEFCHPRLNENNRNEREGSERDTIDKSIANDYHHCKKSAFCVVILSGPMLLSNK